MESRHPHTIFVNSLLVVALFLTCCSNEKNIVSPPAASDTSGIFTYYFREAVIPDHRSFTIKVTSLYTFLTVEDWDSVVLKDSILIPKASYDSFATAIYNLHITNRPEIKGPPCAGGTTEWFTFYSGSREVKGWINYCGEANHTNGNLAGDLIAATKLFHAIIPDLWERIDATIKDE